MLGGVCAARQPSATRLRLLPLLAFGSSTSFREGIEGNQKLSFATLTFGYIMSFRSEDERTLLLVFYEWLDNRRKTLDDPDAIPVDELIDVFIEERKAK
jgi:hypothetical protein